MERGGYRGRGGGGRRGGARDAGRGAGGRDGGRGSGGRDGGRGFGGRDGGRGSGGRDGSRGLGGRDGGRGFGGRDGGRDGAGGRGNQQQQQYQQQWTPSSDQGGRGAQWPQPQAQPLASAQSNPVRGGGGGGGRGGGWGVQASYASAVTPPPATVQSRTPSLESVREGPAVMEVPSGSSKQLASSSSPKENPDKKMPIRRPDKGGVVAVRRINIRVNHFPVCFNSESIIRHYDIEVKPDGLAKNDRRAKILKSDLSVIRNKLFNDNPSQFPLSMTAYDGEKNLFSAVSLPTGIFKVEFPEGEEMKGRSYLFTIKLVNELKLCKLNDYIAGNLYSIPRDILQGMDVVMKEHPSRCMISVGRSFFSRETGPDDELGYGLVASKGYQNTLKLTSQGLVLCLDYSVLALRKTMPVIDYLKEHIYGFDLRQFRSFRRQVEDALSKLKVTVTHRKTKQKFTIVGLSEMDTKRIEFDWIDPEGKEPSRKISLVEYFRDKYAKDIKYKDIPCLDLGKNNRKNYVPMEFCVLFEGQIYPKDQLDKETGLWLKQLSLVKPRERLGNISKMVQSENGPTGGDITRNFGLEVTKDMTLVDGRILKPPTLKLGDRGKMINVMPDKDRNQWNLVNRGLTRGTTVKCWGVLDFTAFERNERYKLHGNFIGKLIDRCWDLGMQMEEPLLYETARMSKFSNVKELEALLRGVTEKANRMSGGNCLQLLLCVMTQRDNGYKYLKWIAETKLGLVTQCCLSGNANKGNDQYLANLAMKINGKLGGSNVELANSFPFFKGDDTVMFIGADVNHPAARNTTSPSIVAVVGTMNWPEANRYAARVHAQFHRKEQILDFGNMCLDLVDTYAKLNGGRPKKIVIFRDGVSDGQFDMVLNEELMDLKVVFAKVGYNPIVTLIVAQKRHQTRFFPNSERDGSNTGNVPSGTVVDTRIIHPFEFDFYLCSHYGEMGTSKPTHYYVLWDEHGFSSDNLQKLIFDVCFTFFRCTKPVSLVPPVYYADLVAYRGRLYHEAAMEEQSQLLSRGYAASSSSSSPVPSFASLSLEASVEERFYNLHPELESVMFFI